MAVRRSRHHLRGGRQQRRVSNRFVVAGRIPYQRQRHPLLLRGRRRTTRQGAGCPRTHPDAREDHHLRHGRPARSGRPDMRLVRGTTANRPGLRRPTSGCLGPGDRPCRPRRPDDPDLYLGHHRAAQGRDDLPGQRHVHDGRDDGKLHRLRFGRAARFPAPGTRRWARLLHLPGHDRSLRREPCREPRNAGPGSAGGVPDGSFRGAEGVGEAVLRGAHHAEGVDRPRSLRLQRRHGCGRAPRTLPEGEPARTVAAATGLLLP